MQFFFFPPKYVWTFEFLNSSSRIFYNFFHVFNTETMRRTICVENDAWMLWLMSKTCIYTLVAELTDFLSFWELLNIFVSATSSLTSTLVWFSFSCSKTHCITLSTELCLHSNVILRSLIMTASSITKLAGEQSINKKLKKDILVKTYKQI